MNYCSPSTVMYYHINYKSMENRVKLFTVINYMFNCICCNHLNEIIGHVENTIERLENQLLGSKKKCKNCGEIAHIDGQMHFTPKSFELMSFSYSEPTQNNKDVTTISESQIIPSIGDILRFKNIPLPLSILQSMDFEQKLEFYQCSADEWKLLQEKHLSLQNYKICQFLKDVFNSSEK